MPTTVHIPSKLLGDVDKRAKTLRLSRNRLIVRALERELHQPSGWSPEFFERLREVTPGDADAVDDMMAGVRAARRSKRPLAL